MPSDSLAPPGAQRTSSRRGHAPQISITDTNHHVTEAIGGMYGSDDDDDYPQPGPQSHRYRPLSFLPSQGPYNGPHDFDHKQISPLRTSHEMAAMQDTISVRTEAGLQFHPAPRPASSNYGDSVDSDVVPHHSPTQDTATQQFPLNDIDYESSPAAVAQELSNLQAIRRMSMNVDAADPDLPSFSPGFGIPSPPHTDDEDDASRLFWVPARLHPELAPKEFKTFIEDRVERMKRMSDDGSLAVSGLERQGSSSSLGRRKSMLSRQISTDKGYVDGSTRLERKRSSRVISGSQPAKLAELEELVSDPSTLMRTLSIDTVRSSQDSGVGVAATEDLPFAPSLSNGLKRSTRTAYGKGSLRKGMRTSGSKRAIGRSTDGDTLSPDQSPQLQTSESMPGITQVMQDNQRPPSAQDDPVPGISRVRTEPIGSSFGFSDQGNFSRPGRRNRGGFGPGVAVDDNFTQQQSHTEEHQSTHQDDGRSQHFHSRIASNGWTTAQLPGQNAPTPHIIEAPPAPEPPAHSHIFPERRSSKQQVAPQPPAHAMQRPSLIAARSRQQSHEKKPAATLDEMSSNPSPIPGGGASRTDDLTVIPSFDTRKVEVKSGRKTSWGWLLGSEDKERERAEKEAAKERERKAQREREAQAQREREEREREKEKLRRPKISSKLANPDKARLDVLQTSIDSGSRGRESLVLNREDFKLEEERKKESSRRSREDGKKDKDSSLLSAIFGGGKRSKNPDDPRKRSTARSLSPDPTPRALRPDIDYNWTRFSILEERAIYRMAHIKLANPKRALHSQVLLSNFMYSYLAKVQLMHPRAQQRQEPERTPQEEDYLRWTEAQEQPLSRQAAHDYGPYPQDGGGEYQHDGGYNQNEGYEHSGYEQRYDAEGYGQYHQTDYLGQQSKGYEDDAEAWSKAAEGNMFDGLK